eukprot:5175569-Amphidinium_carterae.1
MAEVSSELLSLEGQMGKELEGQVEAVRVRFRSKRAELETQLEQLQSAQSNLVEVGMPQQATMDSDWAVIQRIASQLCAKMPQYKQAFDEFVSVAAEQIFQPAAPLSIAEAKRELGEPANAQPAPRRHISGIGVWPARALQTGCHSLRKQPV